MYTTQIDCPEHPGKHTATLYMAGHEYGGTWECPTGVSDIHEHTDYQIEEDEVDTIRNGEHDTYPVRYYICGLCRMDIPIEEANPDIDAADAEADRQIDEAQ